MEYLHRADPTHIYARPALHGHLTVTHADGRNYHCQTEYIKAYDSPVADSRLTSRRALSLAGSSPTRPTGSPTLGLGLRGRSTSDGRTRFNTYTAAGTYT